MGTRIIALGGALFVALITPVASAGLIGTDVVWTGYRRDGTVFVGPATQTVGSGIEFSFFSPPGILSADFDDASLGIRLLFGGAGIPWTIYFSFVFESLSPGAFGSVVETANSFPPVTFATASLGDRITFTFDPGSTTFPGNYDWTATYDVAAIPEPATYTLVGCGALWLMVRRRQSRRSKSAS